MAAEDTSKRPVSPSIVRMSHLQAEFSKLESDWKELQAHRPSSRIRSRPMSRDVGGSDPGLRQPGTEALQIGAASTSGTGGPAAPAQNALSDAGANRPAAGPHKFQDGHAVAAATAGGAAKGVPGAASAAAQAQPSTSHPFPSGPHCSPLRPRSPHVSMVADIPKPGAAKPGQTSMGKASAPMAAPAPTNHANSAQRAGGQAGKAGAAPIAAHTAAPQQPAAAATPVTASKIPGGGSAKAAGEGVAAGSTVRKPSRPKERPAWNSEFADIPAPPFTALTPPSDSGSTAAAAPAAAVAATPPTGRVKAPITLTVVTPTGVQGQQQVDTPVLAQPQVSPHKRGIKTNPGQPTAQQQIVTSPTSPSATLGSVGSRIPSPGPSQRSGSTHRSRSRIPTIMLDAQSGSNAKFSDLGGDSDLGLSIRSDNSPGPSPGTHLTHGTALDTVPEQPQKQQVSKNAGATPSGSAVSTATKPLQRRLWGQDSTPAVGSASGGQTGVAASPPPARPAAAGDTCGQPPFRRRSSAGSVRPTPPCSPPGILGGARGVSDDGAAQATQGQAALSAALAAAAAAGGQSADELNTSLRRKANPDFMRKLSALKRTVTVPDVGAGATLGIPATVLEDEPTQGLGHTHSSSLAGGPHAPRAGRTAAEDQPLAALAHSRRAASLSSMALAAGNVAAGDGGIGGGRPASRGCTTSPMNRTRASPLRMSQVPAERVQSPVVLGSDMSRARASVSSRPTTPSAVPQPTAVIGSSTGPDGEQLPCTSELLVVSAPEHDSTGEPGGASAAVAAGAGGASKHKALAALARQRNAVVAQAMAAAAANAASATGVAGEAAGMRVSLSVAENTPVVLGDGAGASTGSRPGAGGMGDSQWGAAPVWASTTSVSSYAGPSGSTSWEAPPGLMATSGSVSYSPLAGAGGSSGDVGTNVGAPGGRQRARWHIPDPEPTLAPAQAPARWGPQQGQGAGGAAVYVPLVPQGPAAHVEQLPVWAGGAGDGMGASGKPLSAGPHGPAPNGGPPGYMLVRSSSDNYANVQGMRPNEWQLPPPPPQYQPPSHMYNPQQGPPTLHMGYGGAPPPWGMQGPPAGAGGQNYSHPPLPPPPPSMWQNGFAAGGFAAGAPGHYPPRGMGMPGMSMGPPPPMGYGHNPPPGPHIDGYAGPRGYWAHGQPGRHHQHYPTAEPPDYLPDYLRQSRSKFTTGWSASPHEAEAGALSAFADVWRQRQHQPPARSAAELAQERRNAAMQSAFEGMSLGEVLARAPKKEPPFPRKGVSVNNAPPPKSGGGSPGAGPGSSTGGGQEAGGSGMSAAGPAQPAGV